MTPGEWAGAIYVGGVLLAAIHMWIKLDGFIRREERGKASTTERDLLSSLRPVARLIGLPVFIVFSCLIFWPVLLLVALVEYVLRAVLFVLETFFPDDEGAGTSEEVGDGHGTTPGTP